MQSSPVIKYKNVVVSGLPGAGSTTLAKLLKEKLDWEYFSGGDFMRSYAISKGLFDPSTKTHHYATAYSEEFDREVDYGMRRNFIEKEGVVYDSWLCGFLAQGVPGTFKILVTCSEDTVRVDRLANRDKLTIAEAKEHIFDREKKNVEKWRKMYQKEWDEWVVEPGIVGPDKEVYYWYPEMYDLVIDTFKVSKQEAFDLAWRSLHA